MHRAVCHLPVPTALFVSGLRVVWQPFRRAAADTDSAIETRARSRAQLTSPACHLQRISSLNEIFTRDVRYGECCFRMQ